MAKQIINNAERIINWSGGSEEQNTFDPQMDFYVERAKNKDDYPN